jgi:GTP cyclohydrolase I
MYARRLQLQERLTEQISQAIMELIGARGVEKQNSVMVTSSVLGTFRESQATREEFLALVGHTAT